MGDTTFAGGASARRRLGSARRVALGALAMLAVLALPAAPSAAKPGSYLAGDRSLVDHYAAIEGAKLGVTLTGGPEHFIEVKESSKATIPTPSGPALGVAPCHDSGGGAVGPAVGCVVEFAVSPHTDGELKATAAHEVFHVFQAVMSGTLANFEGSPVRTWLIEGSAQWAESDLVRPNPGSRGWWKQYLRSPGIALFARTNSAIGFFGHLASTGISPWKRFNAMFAATGSVAAYTAAVGSNEGFLDSEASVFFREPALGSVWDQAGPDVPSRAQVGFHPTAITVTDKTGPLTEKVKPYADGAFALSIAGLSPREPVVEVDLVSGHLRVRSTSGGKVNAVDPTQLLLCSNPKGCSCPLRPNHYQQFQKGDLAITGGPAGAAVKLTRRKPCEVLLPAAPCETLLPGFTGPGPPLSATHTGPEGNVASSCAALSKGVQGINLEGEKAFVGVIAPFVSTLRATSVGGAETYYALITSTVPGGYTVSHPVGVGDESALFTKSGANATGQVEYASFAFVRVQNVVADYALLGTPGNVEASPAESLKLLAVVARKL